MEDWLKYFDGVQDQLDELKNIVPDSKDLAEHGRKLSKLQIRYDLINALDNAKQKLIDSEIAFKKELDPEMQELWQYEIEIAKIEIEAAHSNIKDELLPNSSEGLILEIRAGEGGEEASLFAHELSDMYLRWSKKRGWKFLEFSTNYNEIGGLKEGVFQVTGKGVASWFLSENGVHCVKRVPKTEKKGRIHTSTATVAVMREPEAVDIIIEEKDLKIDVFRSSGPGGQSVNTTDSAVRITHLPTGLVVSQQDEKSQHRNKEKGMKVLRARLFELKQQEQMLEQAELRRNVIGKAKRTERIRTYHFVQNWVKDERIEQMNYNVAAFMEGIGLEEFSQKLIWNVIEK